MFEMESCWMGKLTGAEKGQINGEQNKASQKIYQDKHNGARQRK